MYPLTLVVALATALTAVEASSLISGLIIRQANTGVGGGFATRLPTCSTGQVDCGGGIAQEICCPSGTFCFHNSDGVCCPTNTDCTEQIFEAPKCSDPSWFLCTDYLPNIPGYVPNDPGYWCCPSGTQCLVTENAGFTCGSPNSGDVPGSTVLSGQAPTQASTATTFPLSAPTGGTKPPSTTGAGSSPAGSSPAGTTPPPTKNSAIKTSSHEMFVAQALFALTLAVLL
ncbi:hypothetical protein GALMADRAFT_235156 [Galerina marginata CBS 339.88]|uniref:Granulins domain-containing protein n=1 Tax=Galerina marginata (strain CBS 339.88) TaxID=685588 RepID=A0A067TUI0_GALM3|nr:hypothetical protein GALMADRAFT_235156 [Galerina marginata CBS 339.88]